MNMLSNSMERLSMSQPIELSSTVTEKKDIQLKKHETHCRGVFRTLSNI